ncbi:hypothetical protein HFN53_17075 [Rhizobium leguminosarum]|nr:hypothetical protein [Rhizobium leguminosarum]
MARRRFVGWTVDDLQRAIRELEEAQTSGAATVSFGGPGGGSVSWVTYDNMDRVLTDLYRALDRASGIETPSQVRFIQTVVRSGY